MSTEFLRQRGKSGQQIFEPGAAFVCGRCGKTIRRKGPFLQHQQVCKGKTSAFRVCGNCGNAYHKRVFGGHRTSCLGRNTFFNPGVHRKAMQKRSQNKAYRKYLSERMKGEKNPAKREDVKAKMRVGTYAAIARGVVPYGRGSGGKGRGPTESEKLAAQWLEPLGFIPEFVVRTGLRRPGLASWYSLDLAHPERKIGVEIDGSSHQNRLEVDERKDAWLLENGWAVIRVPASQVLVAREWLLGECSKLRQSRRRVRRFLISK